MPEIRFLADVMLGKLAKWLRILGYDTEYFRAPGCDELLRRACAEDRQLLTRSTRLARLPDPQNRICFIRDNDPALQVREVLSRYHLVISPAAPLTRCLICNLPLVRTAPALLASRVPEYVLATRQLFLSCPDCHKVYWRGTHYQNMQERIKQAFIDK
jgi:uncharacterized protein with PIN domain